MAQFNYMNVRDSAGLGADDRQREQMNALTMRRQQQGMDQDQQAFDEDTQFRNTQMLASVSGELLELAQSNPAQYQRILPQAIDDLARSGIVDPSKIEMRKITPELLSDINKQATMALQGYQGQTAPADRKYEKSADGRYRYVDTQELVYPNVEPAEEIGSDVRTAQWYANATPEEREAFDTTKRGPQGPSSALETRLYEVNDRAFQAAGNAEKYERLANELIKTDPDSGETAKWTEVYKKITGTEDAVTLLRKRWNELRVGAAVQNLPPGVASDKDIELVMSAFLPEFADPDTIAAFMRGLAKVERLNEQYADFESGYLTQNLSPVGMKAAWKKHIAEKSGEVSGDDDEANRQKLIEFARQAIASGADRGAVLERLRGQGVTPPDDL